MFGEGTRIVSIRIGSNISSLQAQRMLGKATDELARSTQRLSSGMRINSAADDAAGLAIATSLKADSRIYTQAIRNVNDGLSVLNIAQGTISELSDIVIRLKELTFQSANGTYSLTQRKAMSGEADQLVNEFNRMLGTTRFNGVGLLDGSARELAIQLGRGEGSTLFSSVGGALGRNVGTGQVNSATAISSANGTGDYSHVVDINNDGKLDLVHGATSQANAFVVQLGNGDGTFRAEVSYYGEYAAHTRIGDLNNDGIIDIYGVGNSGGTVAVALGNGDGSFRVGKTFSAGLTGISLRNFEGADVNGDGITDIVNMSSTVNGYSVMIGNGDGTFRVGISYSISAGIDANSEFSLGDLNNDGVVDLVYTTTGSNVVALYGNGDGTFGGAQTLAIGAGRSTGISLADLDRDGALDIVTIGSTGNTTRVLMGNGNGTFDAVMSFNTSAAYNHPTLADLNSDGIFDLVTADYTTGRIETLIGNGDGSFKAMTSYASGLGNMFRASVGDIDGDGSAEIVFGANATRSVIAYQSEIFSSNLEYLNLNSRTSALSSLGYLESATQRIQKELGLIGSFMSRFQVAANHLSVSREQYEAAHSRIMDSDIAEETSKMLSQQILQKASAAILAQANQQPALALSLLGGIK